MVVRMKLAYLAIDLELPFAPNQCHVHVSRYGDEDGNSDGVDGKAVSFSSVNLPV